MDEKNRDRLVFENLICEIYLSLTQVLAENGDRQYLDKTQKDFAEGVCTLMNALRDDLIPETSKLMLKFS